MLVLCGGAFLVGVAASLSIPFAPFAVALLASIAIGGGWSGLHGAGFWQVVLSALALLVSTQVGYALGLVGAAGAESARRSLRRPASSKPVPPTMSDLGIGEKP